MENGRYYISNFLISLFMGIFLLLSIFFSYAYFGFNMLEILFVILVCVLLYALVIIVLISTSARRVVKMGAVKEGQRSENDIINAIVDEVYKESEDIKTGFVGNSKSKLYHKVECPLASKIDQKFRLENTTEDFFKKRKFKKCKTCFKN